MPTQTWIIEGETFGPYNVPLERIHAEYHRPFSIAFFCPFCGEIWARRIITPETEYSVWTRSCSRHANSPSRGLAGSVWLGFGTDSDRNLPPGVLRREALLHIGADNSDLSTL